MDATILLVDDEDNVRTTLRSYLERNGFTVALAATGTEAVQKASELAPDLIILDVSLPELDGLEVCGAIRRQLHYIPILMMSGTHKAVMDRVVGLGIGADKYLLKPFEPHILVAEVRALLRTARATRGADGPALAPPGDHGERWLVVDDWLQINRQLRAVRVGETEPRLTVLEFDLLLYLLDHAGEPCARDDLIEQVWRDTTGGVSDLAVTSCVARLRKKIEPDPTQPTYIRSMYGWGYKFCGFEI